MNDYIISFNISRQKGKISKDIFDESFDSIYLFTKLWKREKKLIPESLCKTNLCYLQPAPDKGSA